ncbi:MAG: response regulator transcription factor [Chitinispirillaceae bacterium]|nr:response regulator transcription factor [Chitinispirillaceae bacterium]
MIAYKTIIRIILKRLLKRNFSPVTDICECESADKAVMDIPSFAPDILLVDVSLPGMDGIELIRKIKPQCQNTGIIVLTGYEIDQYKKAALSAGAHDIVSKSDSEGLLRSIRELLAGKNGSI